MLRCEVKIAQIPKKKQNRTLAESKFLVFERQSNAKH